MVNPLSYSKLGLVIFSLLFFSTNVDKGVYDYSASNVNVETGNEMATIQAMMSPCTTGLIGGSVFVDHNSDGEDNGVSENAFAGIKVQIFALDGNDNLELIETVFTDSQGDYEFTAPSIVLGTEKYIG
jgi:hypothetical protein